MHILLADDHAIFRQGLALLLQCQPGYRIVAEAARLDEVLPLVQQHAPQLLILDYHMPGGESSAVLAYCKQRYPALKVIALTGAQSGMAYRQLIDAGADAVMVKDASAPELLRCIADVMAGRKVVPEHVREQAEAVDSGLTPREAQILQLIYQGMATAEVAVQLNLSVKTIDKHRENLMRKLGVNNVVQLIHKVQELKLV
ncbi:response regulator transcription factor [Pseudoduganella sp. OTU4001]|uniref:response regulator transcription factor n=1 Tax=Pseudoduganella sp. OTU4001 TaxID=3043854 RepID=UPI00313CF713